MLSNATMHDVRFVPAHGIDDPLQREAFVALAQRVLPADSVFLCDPLVHALEVAAYFKLETAALPKPARIERVVACVEGLLPNGHTLFERGLAMGLALMAVSEGLTFADD